MRGALVPALAGLVCLAGCEVETSGPTHHDFRTFELDQSEVVRVNLHMGAGNLRVNSGTDKLAAADFTYNVAGWEPVAHYASAAGRGTLTISQPETGRPTLGSSHYEWDVR